jgi:hypothetical protein
VDTGAEEVVVIAGIVAAGLVAAGELDAGWVAGEVLAMGVVVLVLLQAVIITTHTNNNATGINNFFTISSGYS